MKKNLLEAEMKRFGDSNETLAGALEITPTTLSRKKNGGSDFTLPELEEIKSRYGLGAEQMDEIFFTK